MKSPFGDFFFLGDAMTADAFSNCHPAVNFLFFVGAIGFSVLIQHPAYLIAGAIGAAVYYLLLSGRAGWKRIAMLLPMFLALTVVNRCSTPTASGCCFMCSEDPTRWRRCSTARLSPGCFW